MTSADPLLQPYTLKHLTMRNRVMSTAHEPAFTDEGMPKDRYRLYHSEKAKGGIALTMIGGSSIVAPDSPQLFGNIMLYKDEVVPWLRELSDDVHSHGAAVMIQITHLGRRATWSKADWLPTVAPSSIREPAHRAYPKSMEEWDVTRIVKDYADAAERVKAGGLDGFELQCYGHLIDQFWSPITNHRDDEYAGSLDNRLRFLFRIIGAIRERVGPDFIVGSRLVCDEQTPRGLSKEEGIAIARKLEASGQFDFLNVVQGRTESEELLSHMIPGMGTPSAPQLDLAAEVRRASGMPTFHAARIQDVATARHAIATGKVDMIGMTRAHMADPHIVNKIIGRNEDDIRPCVGMGYCIDSIYGGQASCIHNPATGREATVPHVITPTTGPTKKVVVIGAGPGGLEAARVAAERGHEVVVFEASDAAGGQVRIAAGLKRRREIMGIIDWRLARCEQHGVEIRYNTFAEVDTVLKENPDVVIVATGGMPNTSFLDAGEDLVTTSWDILTGAERPAQSVILYDDNGAHPGMTTAEFLAQSDCSISFVTPERSLAPDVGSTGFPPYFRVFRQKGVAITLGLRLEAVHRDGCALVATFYDEYGRQHIEKQADQIVVEHGTLPLEELYFDLKPDSTNLGEVDYQAMIENRVQDVMQNPNGSFRLYRVGDAISGRNILAAIYDSIRLTKDM